jgi:aminopeptidase N
VIVNQTQENTVFRLPIAVDIYNGSNKVRHNVWLNNKTDTLSFSYTSKPDLVNVDGDKMLLSEKTDNKTADNYIHQYKYAGKYLDRREAIDFAAESSEAKALDLLKTALKDKYYPLRIHTMKKLNMKDETVRNAAEPLIADLASNDEKSLAKATAISLLATYGDKKYEAIFLKNVDDSSYSVAGAALEGLFAVDPDKAVIIAKKLNAQSIKGKLAESVVRVMMSISDESGFDEIVSKFSKMPLGQAKFNLLPPLSEMLVKINDTEKVKKGVDQIVQFRDAVPAEYGISPFINSLLNNIIIKKQGSSNPNAKEQIEYIKSKISK